jgi:putative component of membrane protein insertase Oxa1/YidC/SpoIIIJ protein YidD
MCFRWILALLPLFAWAEEPWGVDFELAEPFQEEVSSPSLLSAFGEAAIRFHQEVISPADGPRSHFFPSSSQYALESIRKHGFFRGVTMGCDRLMRENNEDWVYRVISPDEEKYGLHRRVLKYDPVP